jgi:polyisoprenyl-phosphate glycosyltransferase
MKKVSVVIPVYCAADTLPFLNEEFLKIDSELEDLGIELELIYVDDGSTDNTLLLLLDFKKQRPDTCIVKLTRNFGAVKAVKAGFQQVTGDCFMAIAADLQDPVDLIPTLAKKWLEGSKYTILARRDRDDPISSKLFAWVFYFLIRKLIFESYPRGGFDVALMDNVFLEHLKRSGKNINPSLYSYYLGFEPVIIPYDRRKRAKGKSKWGFGRKANYFIDSLLGFSIAPLRIVTAIGAIVAMTSFAFGIVIVVSALFKGSPVPGFPSLAALVSFLSGTSLFVSALIGEYVWRIFDQVNQRPESVVEDIF